MAAARALLLLLLLLLAPPDSSAAPGSSAADAFASFVVKHGKEVVEAISTIRDETTKYIKENKKPGVKDISGGRYNGDDHQLGSSAADSYGALIFNLSVGTSASPQILPFVMDITSKLVWAQCGGEPGPAEAPTFLPNGSNSFTPIGCADKKCKSLIPKYKCTDPDDHCGGTSRYLATETFNFDTTPIPGVVFGCIGMVMARRLQVQGASGSAGFSRGALSLVSQLNISRFSYFIDDSGNDKSFVSFGDADDTPPAKGSHSTPLLPPAKGQNPDLYYVKLTGVQVDGELLADIPEGTFDVRADGSGGVFLSTTLPLTYLDKAAHKVLRQKLASRILSQRVVGLPVNAADEDQLCFPTKDFANVKVPRVALVFDGEDAAMELNVKNYFFDVAGGYTCLSILPSTGGSVLGSLLQMGRNMTYDIHGSGGGLLTFELAAEGTSAATSAPAAAAAGAPAPAQVSPVIIAALLGWVLLF